MVLSYENRARGCGGRMSRGLKQLGDRGAVLVDAVVAQLLAFFRSMQEGLRIYGINLPETVLRIVYSKMPLVK